MAVYCNILRLYLSCINGFLKNKLRVLCTHQTQFLRNADQILVLNKEGQIDGYGTHKELMADGNKFLDDDKIVVLGKKAETNVIAEEKSETADNATEESEELKRFRRQESKVENEEEEDEDKFVGKITWKSYSDFFTAGTSFGMLAVVILFCIVAQTLQNLSDFWMAYW